MYENLSLLWQPRRAQHLAAVMHAGQMWGPHHPYMTHLVRTVGELSSHPEWGSVVGDDMTLCVTAAWLHDAVEDTPLTLKDLRRFGFPEAVVEMVGVLTHPEGMSNKNYWAVVREHRLARIVKQADIATNYGALDETDLPEERRERLREKYLRAIEALA